MAFKQSVQKFTGKINEVEIGTGEKAIKLGGENVMPFYSFDGSMGQRPKVGMEILDVYPEAWCDSLKGIYKDVANDSVAWAKFVEEKFHPDFICLKFEGSDPNGLNKSVDECATLAKQVAQSVALPLVIAGSNNHEKDGQLFEKVAQALEGSNVLLLAAVEENYKTVGAAGGLAYKHKVGAESSVDINLAKQLNILLTQLGVKAEDMVMNVGCAAVGYGFEYVTSTMDRIRLAAFGQNDKTLQMPIMAPVSFETWSVKESIASEEEMADWGCQEERGIAMEVSTAASMLTGGADAVILRHPKSVETVNTFIKEIVG
ncbi:acetyl-CoA decarbonylase/synthase complex subunit delta [Anaerosolibacter carboniphilus]|uniref:Acetyl-CoA decarbonylase/synthase complex subunit delta n=1 Tax=Anaerosolibacter carboniphilus TaxID=1417629 RepID=A0A841KP29_9FIRM|nr:acetyl-CoA decarbonylase/synthase complex subunit delta [Anaerosolibacter carboniphilus]